MLPEAAEPLVTENTNEYAQHQLPERKQCAPHVSSDGAPG